MCPRKVFLSDLCDLIKEFIDTGDHIILLIDANTNLKRSDPQQALQELSLKEAIRERHALQGPSTFWRNNMDNPIDGIWMSPGLEIEAGGYFDYDEVFL
jgi:hypothetical protein